MTDTDADKEVPIVPRLLDQVTADLASNDLLPHQERAAKAAERAAFVLRARSPISQGSVDPMQTLVVAQFILNGGEDECAEDAVAVGTTEDLPDNVFAVVYASCKDGTMKRLVHVPGDTEGEDLPAHWAEVDPGRSMDQWYLVEETEVHSWIPLSPGIAW